MNKPLLSHLKCCNSCILILRYLKHDKKHENNYKNSNTILAFKLNPMFELQFALEQCLLAGEGLSLVKLNLREVFFKHE